MPTRPHDDRLLDILEQWDRLRRAGHEANIEELCAGCQELAGELRRCIVDLEHLDSLLTDGDSDSPRTGARTLDGDNDRDYSTTPTLMPSVMSFGDLHYRARGGQSEVFEGQDESLGRSVAIKLLGRHRAGSPESRRRFEKEAEITSRLEHPGIAPIYCVGNAGDGRPYYAMRFIRGETLHDAIDRFHSSDRQGREPGERRLVFRQLLVRFQEVCNTIAYAHSRGVLHRDLKPRNVMLGEFGETIVVDWGLGKRLSQESPPLDQPSHNGWGEDLSANEGDTRPDEAMGSPGYMSPEQAVGELDQIGSASDIFGLGAVLYCLLTGPPPFSGSDLATIVRRTRTGDLAPPSRVNRQVHPGLEAVCLKAMARRPEERYASPKDLAEEIGRWMADEPVAAWREPITTRLRRWRADTAHSSPRLRWPSFHASSHWAHFFMTCGFVELVRGRLAWPRREGW